MDGFNGSLAVRLYSGSIRKDVVKTPKGKEYQLLSLPYFLAGKVGEYV
jgi:hypothetical protein